MCQKKLAVGESLLTDILVFLCRAQGQVNLPSISLKRRSGNTKGKKPKTTLYDRDIVCLPFSYPSSGGRYAIPRKESRAFLASQGLIGKIRLSSDMDEDEILREIRSVFSVAMAYDTTFPITLLQWCGSGVNALAVPSLSQSFAWTAREVIRLAGQGCIYVKAEKELILPECQRNVIVSMTCIFYLTNIYGPVLLLSIQIKGCIELLLL